MKKVSILLLSILLSCLPLMAQNIDQVQLKNGTTIRGNIQELVPDGNVVINDMAGNTWVYSMVEVAKIDDIEKETCDLRFFTPGFRNATSIGFLAGPQNSNYIAPFSAQTSFGYMTNFGLYTGVSAGLEFLNVNYMPLMLDINYSLNNRNVAPVAIVKAGYTIPLNNSSEMYNTEYSYFGGPSASVGMAIRIQKQENISWDISMLYRYMIVSRTEKYEWQDYTQTYEDQYNRLELRIGMFFGL